MALLRKLFWIALFLATTFAFTVLFEHGTANFGANAEKEWQTLTKFYSDSQAGKGSADAPAR